MTDGLPKRTPALRGPAVVLILLGVSQLALIAAAFSRVIDPGPATFDTVGVLAGLGMVVGVVATTWTAHGRTPAAFWFASGAAALASFAYATVWATLLGGTFLLDDVVRISLLVASDLVVAGWFLMAAWTLKPPRPPGPGSLGIALMVRAIIEARYLIGVLFPGPPRNAGSTSGIEGVFIGVLVLSGIVVLAFWQIAIGRWMLRASRSSGSLTDAR